MLISPWKGMEEDRSRRGESGDGPSGSGSAWRPRGGVFRSYTLSQSSGGTSQKSGNLRVVVRRPMVARLTKYLIDTYQSCNPSFQYSESLNPKRFLTNPSVGVLNDGFDNANSDLILYVNLVLVNSQSNQRYIVKDILGQGTFGQVAKCWVLETNSYVAVKVIKNQPAYYQQAVVEVNILNTLNRFDPDDKHHIVRILDFFVFQHHLCITFEMLGSNLFDLLKMNHFKGLSLSIVQMFSKQILHALVVMKDAGIIHCDLKPENILISTSVKPAGIKVIDFGSACKEGQTVYSYIQSRYYRSPEVLLGYPYTTAIDMWSFGCIVAELFLGLPLFPGASEYDLLKRMIDVLGAQPPDDLLRDAKNTSKFFKHVGSIYHLEDDGGCKRSMSLFRILTEEEYEARESKKPVIGKQYFPHVMLEDMVTKYPHRKNLLEEEISKENLTRLALLDFLRGLVEFDPGKRWSPWQASQHPFVTGEPFSHPYKPPPDAPRIPVIHTVTVDHNPIGGHWLAAGFSPQVVNLNQCIPRNGSRVQMTPFSYGSYGSMGSHGSYNDNVGLGSSYGSYGDVNSFYNHYTHIGPSGLSIQAQVGGSLLGASPDARRKPHLSHGSGFTISPSTVNFAPMSLGASPSQFTPPSSQMHISASPGKFGPTSPARCGIHGSPLSKAVAVGQYNRRRNWGNHGTSHIQPQEIAFQQWQGHHVGIIASTHADAYSWGHTSPSTTLSTPSYYSWRQQTSAGNGVSSGPSSENYQNFSASHAPVHVAEMLFDKPDNSSLAPDPADWDPNYSDDLLLQEDNSELTSLSSGVASGMRLNHTTETPTLTSRANQHLRGHNQAHATPNFSLSNQRTGARPQGYLLSDASPTSGHGRLPHFSHKSPSRFGQQPVHRSPSHMQAQTSSVQSEQGHHHRSQQARSIYSMADSHVPASSSLGNGISWVNLSHAGRDFGRAGHPIAATLQSSHASPEFGSIS